MNNLSNSVFNYYLTHFDELAADKQGHFATRLHLWCQEPRVAPYVDRLRPWFTGDEQPERALKTLIEQARETAGHGSKNAGELREQYFKKYPQLKPMVLVLFRINFLQTVYGVDCRHLFYELFQEAEVRALREALLTDTEALSILSTHAINFLYLLDRGIHEDNESLPLQRFIEVGRTAYNRDSNVHVQLLIYLYTHCVIGEARFYYRSIPEYSLPAYTIMMTELEQLIDERFNDINLDNKFEFLVCAKIVGFASRLTDRIFGEAEESISRDGAYLVDRLNNNPQTDNISLDKSEHRNVLFVMANRTFTPLGNQR